MTASVNKKSPGFYLRALPGVLGIAGLVTMVISSTMSSANALYTLPMLAALALVGIVLVALSMFAAKHEILSTAAVLASIALFTAVIGNVMNSRVLMIAGLFSYNSGNTIGWSIFYITVASIICFLVAILLLIAGSFFQTKK